MVHLRLEKEDHLQPASQPGAALDRSCDDADFENQHNVVAIGNDAHIGALRHSWLH